MATFFTIEYTAIKFVATIIISLLIIANNCYSRLLYSFATLKGSNGGPGPQGAAGAKGDAGKRGDKGPPGKPGEQGRIGDTGALGQIGDAVST